MVLGVEGMGRWGSGLRGAGGAGFGFPFGDYG